MAKRRKNLFTPGRGVVPPHRAGHKEAERRLNAMPDRVGKKRPVGGVVLCGPRGTGKTAPLEEVKGQATKRGAGVRWLTPVDWKDGLAEFVVGLPDGVVDEAETKPAPGFDIGVLKARVERHMSAPSRTAGDMLCGLAKSKPLVLPVGEAHRLPPDIGEVFLNAAQRCVTSRLPLLPVPAGTPGLRADLGRADASFRERSRLLRIGRLESRDETRAALSLPAEREGLPFAPDAPDLLVAGSQGYPRLTQSVGEQSWEAAIRRDPGRCACGEQGSGRVEERVREANNRKTLPESVAVSRAFAASGGGALPTTRRGRH